MAAVAVTDSSTTTAVVATVATTAIDAATAVTAAAVTNCLLFSSTILYLLPLQLWLQVLLVLHNYCCHFSGH